VVLGDGGAIFELERRGYISAGPFTPQVVIEHPESVKQLQTDFARAGAEVLQALTYYAHEEKLKDVGAQGKLKEINAQAVQIARQVADEYGCLVAGNLCNTWVYDPRDASTHSKTRGQFDEQIEHQCPYGTDFFIAETIEYLGEAIIALEAAQMGINYIGACCGTAPHHIRAMAEALGRTVPNSKYSPALELHTIIGDASHTREKDDQILCEQRFGKTHCHFVEQQDHHHRNK
jgi:methionine synthase I (cobalamin-dependent)